MACVMSQDAQLGSLAIMVTAGILGGIASRNAALPRLAIAQICLGAVPIGLGALLAPRGASWILVPPLFMYIAAMAAIVRRQSEEGGPLDLTLSDGRQLEMTRNPVPDGSAVIIIEDVTERRQSEAKMLYWARHDPLTGLPNRRYLRERLEIWASGAASSE
jgi:predicted signal transduction protein with EAL and GGDEF domain